MAVRAREFQVIWEVEPPDVADPGRLGSHVDSAARIADAFLVPDNHTGRATVSSIALARHVEASGHRAIACLNARDRNLLGFRRDLLTCSFEGVRDLLLVYGDEPSVGTRASDLTVRTMLEECRIHAPGIRVGVATGRSSLPAWKAGADRLFVQVSYDLDALVDWREQIAYDGPVIPAVMVIPSTRMARRLAAQIPNLRAPDRWLDAIDRDPAAGVELAADLAERIRESGAFDGVHIVAGRRHRPTAARLEAAACAPHPRAVVPV